MPKLQAGTYQNMEEKALNFGRKSPIPGKFGRNDRILPESFFKKVVAIFLFCMKYTKKSAGQSAPVAFDSYPALFQKKKEILHKMKRGS